MKIWIAPFAAFLFSFCAMCPPALSQEEPKEPPPKGEEDDEDELTPEQAVEMLKDIHELMILSENLLNDSSRGRALETEEELIKKLKELFKDDPKALQQQILEKVKKLMQRSEKKQKDAIEKMTELLMRAAAQEQKNQQRQQKKQQQQQPKQGKQKPQTAKSPAVSPYDPNRVDPPSKFTSKATRSQSWGDLPAHVRDAILHGKQDFDEYPEEFQQVLREYMKKLAEEKE